MTEVLRTQVRREHLSVYALSGRGKNGSGQFCYLLYAYKAMDTKYNESQTIES